jgi:hypothetical protein
MTHAAKTELYHDGEYHGARGVDFGVLSAGLVRPPAEKVAVIVDY